jgi:hypothetical protein
MPHYRANVRRNPSTGVILGKNIAIRGDAHSKLHGPIRLRGALHFLVPRNYRVGLQGRSRTPEGLTGTGLTGTDERYPTNERGRIAEHWGTFRLSPSALRNKDLIARAA